MEANGSAQECCLGYMARAEEARMTALKAHDLEAREAWGKIADNWQYLAEQVLLTEDSGESGRG